MYCTLINSGDFQQVEHVKSPFVEMINEQFINNILAFYLIVTQEEVVEIGGRKMILWMIMIVI